MSVLRVKYLSTIQSKAAVFTLLRAVFQTL